MSTVTPRNAGDRRARRPVRAKRRAAAAGDLSHHIYGLHPVAAALGNPERRRRHLLATANALRRLTALDARPDVPVEEVDAARLTRQLGGDAVHQGCLLFCEPLPERTLDDMGSARRLVALDQVTDPHNVGAVLRSCAAFAVDGLIVTARNSPRETPVLAKSAAGAIDYVPMLRVRNLASALEALTRAGVFTVGLEAGSPHTLEACALREPFALVLGAEGKGLRQRTQAVCASLAGLALPGRMPSLNVSNAAALALYVADRTVREAGEGRD